MHTHSWRRRRRQPATNRIALPQPLASSRGLLNSDSTWSAPVSIHGSPRRWGEDCELGNFSRLAAFAVCYFQPAWMWLLTRQSIFPPLYLSRSPRNTARLPACMFPQHFVSKDRYASRSRQISEPLVFPRTTHRSFGGPAFFSVLAIREAYGHIIVSGDSAFVNGRQIFKCVSPQGPTA